MVNRKITKKKGKIFVFFPDLKATFDKVDRKILREMLEWIGVTEQLRKRIIETYKEIKYSVKVENEKSEEFWTENEIRQGCPMSPTLFNVHISDLEDEMKKEQTGVVIEKKKV